MDAELRAAVLSCVNNPHYKPAKPKVIAQQLGLHGDAADDVKKVIKQMVKAGDVAYGANHLVYPAAPPATDVEKAAAKGKGKGAGKGTGEKKSAPPSARPPKHITGTFRRVSGGYGFVRPEGARAVDGRDNDIYIAANKAGDAASGDIVSVRLDNKRGRMGKFEGRVIDVIERATNRFVGTYFERAGMGMVDIDGKLFTQPIYVGDPGAKGARSDDKVVLEMVRFPSHVRDGEGVIVEVLGARGAPGVDTMSIIYEFNLPGDFAEDALDTARGEATRFDESIDDGRRDLTDQVIITIDPADARDFDDAISLEKIEGGHWLLGVHIADVSHFVRPKTPLDREAHDRATSVYLPDRVIPMLPEVISNNLASLQPDRVRYSMTAMIEMTADGAHVATDVFKSAIRSRRRFTYEEVDAYLADRKAWRKKLAPEVHDLLGRMHELAMMLRGRRMKRGALELSMPEMKIDLDADGRVTGAHLEQNTESHQIIEEFMLAANEAVAERLAAQGLLFLRRVHGDPDPRKLKALTEFVRELGLSADNLQSRFELQELLDEIKGDPRQSAVNFAVLRSMQRAVYSPEEEGHYALASDCYCHFTSPIRRYPDLTVHRLIDALNRGRKPEQRMDEMLVLGDHCSEREQRATEAERELVKMKLLGYLSSRIGMEMEGVITGVEKFGLFVTGLELPAEGLIHISALSDDYYNFDRAGHVISGFRKGNEYRLGDTVRVAVAGVDVEGRELDFRLLEKLAGGTTPRKAGKRTAKKKSGKTARKGAAQQGQPQTKGGKKKRKKKNRPGKQERQKSRAKKGKQ